MQVPIDARDRLLAREGLDPAQLSNLQLIYKEPQVGRTTCLVLAGEAAHPGLQQSTLAAFLKPDLRPLCRRWRATWCTASAWKSSSRRASPPS